MKVTPRSRSLLGVTAAILMAACSAPDRIASPSLSAIDAAVVNQTSDIVPGYVRVCKAAGPAGTYTFNVSATGGGTGFFTWGPVVTLNFDGTNPICNSAWIPFVHDGSWDSDPVAQVTVSENVPDGMSVPEIKVFHTALQIDNTEYAYSVFATNTVTVTVKRSDRVKLFYYNIENPPPPPPGFEGCTPGYWKQSQHFGSWTAPYVPTGPGATDFDAAFGVNAFSPNITLLAALGLNGGGLNALARHAAAALLNSVSPGVDYNMTTADVIAAVQAAIASGDYETAKNTLAGFNERGCALGRSELP